MKRAMCIRGLPIQRCARLKKRLAALEQGESCVGTASGMAAILSTFLGLLESGDHIVSSRSVFGTTKALFDRYLKNSALTLLTCP